MVAVSACVRLATTRSNTPRSYGILLNSLDQLGDQVVAPRELHVDIAPSGGHAIAVAHQQVEDNDTPKG